ncbi:hypothetical protein BD310DRAFT_941830 [Dichomitus squalens]|uniref:Uncharacterized protein n=1 Tax=Dichomitus squalens TaxID=114155 RepID=A0A4Q9PAZ6_9APHY|nr:hypothetical protein BD310DRAFT_941830 [Dichomitus squalens]
MRTRRGRCALVPMCALKLPYWSVQVGHYISNIHDTTGRAGQNVGFTAWPATTTVIVVVVAGYDGG